MELQFTVGEAISSAAVGTSSGAARDPWTCTEEQYSPPHSTNSVKPDSLKQQLSLWTFFLTFFSKTNTFFASFLDVKNNDVVPWVLNSILSKYICSQNPHVRQAACIWLLSLVKKLSQHKEITVGWSLLCALCKHCTAVEIRFLKVFVFFLRRRIGATLKIKKNKEELCTSVNLLFKRKSH